MTKPKGIQRLRMVWTSERVERLLGAVEDIAGWTMKMAEAEERVGDILEKALARDSTNFDEGVKEGHRQAQAGIE